MIGGMSPHLLVVALSLLAYLIGSLSGSLLLGRFRGVDIRRHGSGNAGGTNAFRTLGWKFALGVALIDIGKGALATWLALRFAPADASPSVAMVACTRARVASTLPAGPACCAGRARCWCRAMAARRAGWN